MIIEILILILGFVLLVKGADFLIKGALKFTKVTNIPELIVGIVLVGIGTSLPEIILTIKSSLSGNTDLILGNAIGSSICNFLLVLGIASLTKPVKLDLKMCELHLIILAVSIIGLGFLSNYVFNVGYLDKFEGYILLFATILYFLLNIRLTMKSEEVKEDKEKITLKSLIYIIFFCFIGAILLNYGADFVIEAATFIAEYFNVTAEVISLTIIAAGTALPEIITSIMASRQENHDLVMGNLIGSNIFNIIMLPAIGAVIAPIKFGVDLNNNLIFLGLITTGLLVRYVGFGTEFISKKKGFAYIIIYCIYVSVLIV